MTTSSSSLGISPLTCGDSVATVSVITGSKLSTFKLPKSLARITREMSRLKYFPRLVLQLKLMPVRHCCHGHRTIMIVREVFGIAPLGRNFLLRWRFIKIDLHPFVIEDEQRCRRIIVPSKQRERLVKQEHLSLLHVGPERVARALTKPYYWRTMNALIKRIVMSCYDCCRVSRMRLQKLSLEFAETDANQLPLPRQKYGIDFHEHAKGEILVAIDLVTLLPNRKQESVSRVLLFGLVFVKGIPLEFRIGRQRARARAHERTRIGNESLPRG